ncbi:MBL fold metallo-hydrolase [Oscillatoria sp. FACHB-1406]|nr:MBL fold metallo-hydrolase [Oscillatoria sp. FACHB-1406]
MDVREENPAAHFDIQFWGVRGQVAAPGQDTLRYGGNTSCVEMRLNDKRLIFDGGTGLRQLGNSLLGQMPVEAHLFFTDYHWDRIQGFPFFVPGFIPINRFHIYGAGTLDGTTFKERLQAQMLGPNFPVPMQVMQSAMEFHNLTENKTYQLDDVLVEAKFLKETCPSLAYRIQYQGKSVVYATETQALFEGCYDLLLELTKGAELVILDAPMVLRQGESKLKLASLNSSLHSRMTLAKESRAKEVVLSMYHPDDDDNFLDTVEQKLRAITPNICLAREGMVVSVC